MSCNDLPTPTEHAKQLACDLATALDNDGFRRPEMVEPFNGSLYLAAQLLTKYEPEPVDPFLAEARRILAARHSQGSIDLFHEGSVCKHGAASDAILSGRFDTRLDLRGILDVLKCGAEIAGKAAATPKEPSCTDCSDTGITHQTERRCACQPKELPAVSLEDRAAEILEKVISTAAQQGRGYDWPAIAQAATLAALKEGRS